MEQKQQTGPKQWLIFNNGDLEYGIEILSVQELRAYQPDLVTPVANSAKYLLGLINLRGQIIPVIDMRILFALPISQKTTNHCIVILNLDDRFTGMVVDSVSDVITLSNEDIQNPPDNEALVAGKDIIGLAQGEQKLIQLLNIKSLIERHTMSSDGVAKQ